MHLFLQTWITLIRNTETFLGERTDTADRKEVQEKKLATYLVPKYWIYASEQ